MTVDTKYNPGDRVIVRIPWLNREVEATVVDIDLRIRGGGRKITVLYLISYKGFNSREIVDTVRGEYILKSIDE